MCRDLLNEEVSGFWSDAQLNRYIELSNKRLNSIIAATRQDYFTISATFNTIAGTRSYTMPGDAVYIRRMEIYNSADSNYIVKLDELRFPRMEANGDWLFSQNAQPQRYTIVGTHFDLLPIPDAIYPIRIYYDNLRIALVDDIDVPASPLDFHDMIAFYACGLAKKQNEVDDEGFMALFNVRKSELIQILTRRGSDDPQFVESYLEGII